MTCEQIILEGVKVHFPYSQTPNLVSEAMLEVGLDPKTGIVILMNSLAVKDNVAIARAMALKPKLVVLDEPTSALDRTVQVQIVDLLKALQKKHKIAYIFISHDLKVIGSMSHRIVMKDGNIVETGDAEQVYTNPQNTYMKNLLKSVH